MAETTTVRDLFDAIETALRIYFGTSIRQYGAYEPWDPIEDEAEPDLRTPALLIELESLEPDASEEQIPGQIAIRASIAVHVILSILTDQLQIALPELAASVIALVRKRQTEILRAPLSGNRWGLGDAVEIPEAVSAQPAEFRPGLHGHDSWVVRWEQIVYLPETLPT